MWGYNGGGASGTAAMGHLFSQYEANFASVKVQSCFRGYRERRRLGRRRWAATQVQRVWARLR